MNRVQTFLIATLEAAILVAISLGVILAPVTIIWLLENDPSVEWSVAFRVASDFWLLAHGVSLTVPAGEILGIATESFSLSLIPLGFTLFIARLSYNAGKRFLASRALWPGWLGGGVVYGGASLLIGNLSQTDSITPVSWQAVLFPTALFLIFQLLGSLFGQPDVLYEGDVMNQAPEREQIRRWFNDVRLRLHWSLRSLIAPALRAGTATTFLLLLLSSITVAVLVGFNWIPVTRLYESVQVSVLGAIALALLQLLLLPNLIIYTAAWFTGVGFSIGTGSLISPLGTQVGPLPALPVLGALPVGKLEFGMVAIAVVIVAAFVATLMIRSSADEIRFEFATAWSAAISLGLSIGLVAATELTILGVLASGSAGPGRLEQVGINPLWLFGVSFVEVATVATLAAFFSARPQAADAAFGRRVN